MTGLIRAYDAAWLGDLAEVPDDVVVILGYVGGPGASHVWDPRDAAVVRASGRQFWSIWVPPQGRALKGQDGIDAAHGMIQRLPMYQLDKTRPVFLDIEYNQYHMDTVGANLAASTFMATMKAAGYEQPFPYGPYEMHRGWVAQYVYSRPVDLPVGTIGWQYENDKYAHPGWDASVFNSALWHTVGVEWSLDDMKNAVIIRRLPSSGKYYRLNLLDGTCNHLVNPDAVQQCKDDLTSAGIPFTTDSEDSLSGYVQVGS